VSLVTKGKRQSTSIGRGAAEPSEEIGDLIGMIRYSVRLPRSLELLSPTFKLLHQASRTQLIVGIEI
jgi:hypothetical protein